MKRQPQTFEEFVKEVEEAARKGGEHRPRAQAQTSLDNLAPIPGYHKPPPDRQCDFIMRTNARCPNWSMRGATRCQSHGGYRQNPKHPATIRLLLNGDLYEEANERAAAGELHLTDKEIVDTCKTALLAIGAKFNRQMLLQATKAYTADPAGKTWRRYLSSISQAGKGRGSL